MVRSSNLSLVYNTSDTLNRAYPRNGTRAFSSQKIFLKTEQNYLVRLNIFIDDDHVEIKHFSIVPCKIISMKLMNLDKMYQ